MADKGIMVCFKLGNGLDKPAFAMEIEKFAKTKKATAKIFGVEGRGWGKIGKDLQILLLLGNKPDPNVPGYALKVYTQEGLGEAMDLDRSIVSRHLSELKVRKLVKVKTLNIVGETRKRKAYFLTENGVKLVNQIKTQN